MVARDAETYFGVLLDDNDRKPIARLWFNRTPRYLGVFDENKIETRMRVTDIYTHADQLRKTVAGSLTRTGEQAWSPSIQGCRGAQWATTPIDLGKRSRRPRTMAPPGRRSAAVERRTMARYSRSAHDAGPPDHQGACKPWHLCTWCPCPYDHPDRPHQGHQHQRVAEAAQHRLGASADE